MFNTILYQLVSKYYVKDVFLKILSTCLHTTCTFIEVVYTVIVNNYFVFFFTFTLQTSVTILN